jgi:ribosomal protein S24E
MTTLKITKEKENSLFKRKEISATLIVDKLPSRNEITKMLSDKFSQPQDHVKIKKIDGKFGSKTFNIEANVYSSLEEKNFEMKKKKEAPAKAA